MSDKKPLRIVSDNKCDLDSEYRDRLISFVKCFGYLQEGNPVCDSCKVSASCAVARNKILTKISEELEGEDLKVSKLRDMKSNLQKLEAKSKAIKRNSGS